jgi:glycine/D-amino acid oxidase-like deaminating enzyme
MLHMRAGHIASFELDTYRFLRDLVHDNDVPCGWKTLPGVQALTSQALLDLVAERLDQLRAAHPDLAALLRLVTEPAELAALRLGSDALGAVVQEPAAMCWPYKLVSWVLEGLLKEKKETGLFNLQTGTNVVHLQRSGRLWIVHTDRGQIAARDVVVATNAYTSHILPAFTNLITPVRGQVASLVSPDSTAPIPRLEHSHVWAVREDGDPGESDDYLVHRESGELILGGERNATRDAGWATSDDGVVDPHVSRRLRAALHKALTGFPASLPATHEWTGIMGYSADNQPWVGRVPERLGGADGGLWISAGYTGHGMPVAARTGIAVAQMVLGRTGEGTVEIPGEWTISDERASAARVASMPDTVEEEMRVLVEEARKGT